MARQKKIIKSIEFNEEEKVLPDFDFFMKYVFADYTESAHGVAWVMYFLGFFTGTGKYRAYETMFEKIHKRCLEWLVQNNNVTVRKNNTQKGEN